MDGKLIPDFKHREQFIVAGLKTRGNNDQEQLSALWDRFGELHERLGDRVATDSAYGIIDSFDRTTGDFDYMAGVEVYSEEDLPQGIDGWKVLSNNYAVFPTTLNTIRQTIDRIYTEWMPHSNYRRAPGPEFEFYDKQFDPHDRDSTFYLYIPIEPLAGGE